MISVGPYTLRQDQEDAILALRAEIARLKREGLPPRVILQGVCGFGKTIVSSAIVDMVAQKGNRVAFLAHGRQLIFQKSNKLTECEIRHAVLMADVDEDSLDGRYAVPLRGGLDAQVTVASKDTYEARAFSRDTVDRLNVDCLIVDEAHIALSKSWINILSENPDAVVIGLTATPALGNGCGLGGFYNGMIQASGYAHLIDIGALVPCRVFAPYAVDMKGVRPGSNGEYNQRQAAERFNRAELIGDVIENWKKYGEDRPTAVFAQSVAHSIDLAEQFNAAGIPAAHIDADSPQDERQSVFKGLESGRLTVVCNYGVCRTGVDLPFLGCGVLACSMRSITTYLQTVGRFVRSCKNPHWSDGPKRDAIIIDHGGNVYKHGWPTEDREWSLSEEDTVENRDKEKKAKEDFDGELTCFECGAMFDPRKSGGSCPNCGAKKAKRGQKIKSANGEIKEITEKKLKKAEPVSLQKEWMSSLARAAHCNMTIKQASVLFRKKTGKYLPGYVTPQPAFYEWNRKVDVVYPGFARRKKAGA